MVLCYGNPRKLIHPLSRLSRPCHLSLWQELAPQFRNLGEKWQKAVFTHTPISPLTLSPDGLKCLVADKRPSRHLEDEMAGWHHWLDGRESEWTPGVGDGQGGLACCDSWGCKQSDTTERLNWTETWKVLAKGFQNHNFSFHGWMNGWVNEWSKKSLMPLALL